MRAGSIRWDRLNRTGLLVVVGLLLLMYIAPVQRYFAQNKATAEQRQELNFLTQQHAALKKRAAALKRDDTIELEARKLGMAKPDERPYVIVK